MLDIKEQNTPGNFGPKIVSNDTFENEDYNMADLAENKEEKADDSLANGKKRGVSATDSDTETPVSLILLHF